MADLTNISGLNNLSPLKDSLSNNKNNSAQTSLDDKFANVLKKSINAVDEEEKASERAIADLSTGNVKDLHQAAIALSKAENSMKVMMEVRNKALSAYKEVIKTQI